MNINGFVDIYILSGFSNYFDRRIFFYSSLFDYLSHSAEHDHEEGINFNPADGVLTSLNVNVDNADKYSYLLVVDSETNDIISRWFIMECDRNLSGQYKLTLKRDVVAESIGNETFKGKAPIYVEKGHLVDTDPLIVNSEGMNFNQIKQEEIILKDPTGCGYIVGYFESGQGVASKTITISNLTEINSMTIAQMATYTGIDALDIQHMIQGISYPIAIGNLTLTFGTYVTGVIPPFGNFYEFRISPELQMLYPPFMDTGTPFITNRIGTVAPYTTCQASSQYFNALTKSQRQAMLDDVIDNDIPGQKLYTEENLSKLMELIGKVILFGGNYYVFESIDSEGIENHPEVVISKNENTYFDNMIAASLTNGAINDGGEMYLNYQVKNIKIVLKPSKVANLTYELSSSANCLNDAPYSMFVIPFGDKFSFLGQGNIPFLYDQNRIITKEEALAVASDIAKSLGNACYDIQLLPYCPVYDKWVETFQDDGKDYLVFTVHNRVLGGDYDEIKTGGDTIGLIIYPQVSNFSQAFSYPLILHDEMKIESQCNFYRLCSPNYNGLFEFNLAKMGGGTNTFYVDCTYKPINPFIKVAPEFSFLYGTNFNDGRGLICGGDFSLPIMTSAWTTYENNNKNFANIFSREIQNLDFTQKQERLQEAVKLGSGVVGGTAGGALLGGKLSGGNPYAVAGGAAAGAALGIGGGIVDYTMSEARRAETKDYALDRFNMNLDNIKAIPLSLTRISSFNTINRIFPFIEYYTCTEQEKDALRKKIQYDGMTVGRIGYISEFIGVGVQNYFKGQLIRAVGINEDTHFVNSLFEEISKGVYI